MHSEPRPAPPFRQRFLAGDPLLGTFLKTPTVHATAILGDIGFDFVVVDEEHAPFDRAATDHVLLAARAAGTAGIVRVADARPAAILSVLDCGAAGVMVPHVASPAIAREVAAAARYRGGRRGFSNSPRAGRYGALGIWDHVAAADAAATVVAMIEDPEAIDAIDAIVAVEGIDGVFIGRGDLAVALGAPGMDAPAVREATGRIIAAARAAGKAACLMSGSPADAAEMRRLGATAFITGSDQAFLRQAATRALADFSPRAG